ncbi:hypothetical protein PIB30_010611 [Stylosanthes scabra]|uniref:Uncharacterized protein n=1 Tax=Stylosanthes scabra TaxID=79078 RepID=A0ABU6T5C9_9FABA|nr:hypothetical protein [Stylosanthes scabra]
MTEDYLAELKSSGMICGGGEEEILYRVELPRRGERVCGLNLEHPRIPHWLWVNESAIQCFELVTEFLELPQDPEVFLYLFTVFSPNADGKTKKGYMSVCPEKGRRIFGLYEESFHDFKGQYFKVFPVGDHPPFWLTLERDVGQFPSYWSKDAGVNYVTMSYRKLNDEQRDTTDILLWLFSKRNLKPKAILGNPERARVSVVKMAGKNKTLASLRKFMAANPKGPIALSPSGDQASSSVPEGGGSSTVGGGADTRPEVSSPIREEGPEQQIEVIPPFPLGKRANDEVITAQKRSRTSEGSQHDFCPMDRSFDASTYIENNFLGPRAREALQDYDPMESIHWDQWAMLRSATIMKSIEPRLTLADQWEHHCAKLTGDLKMLNQQKANVEKEKEEVETAKSKAEKDLEVALTDAKEKGVELQRLRDREAGLLVDLESAKKKLSEEKSRADQAEASLASTEQARQELVKLAEDSMKATEDALKEKILLLAPDFDVSLLGAWKEVVDGQIVDPPPES